MSQFRRLKLNICFWINTFFVIVNLGLDHKRKKKREKKNKGEQKKK